MKRRKLIKSLIWFLVLVVIASGSYYIGTKQVKVEKEETDPDLEELDEIYTVLNENWLNYNGTDDVKNKLLSGMVAGLEDPYTELLTGDAASELSESLNDNYNGIGIAVGEDFKIDAIQVNSPADDSDLEIGDQISRVDNKSFKNIDELSELLRSDDDTVQLTIKRNGNYNTYEIDKTAQDGTVIYMIQDDTGYIMIRSFGSNTASIVREGLNYFEKENIQNLKIDLRDNLGGYVDSSLNILDYFFKTDTILCTLEDNQGNSTEYRAQSDEIYNFENGSILVNEYTASASEIMAGCLQDKLGYKLIGTQTYGKGIAQTYVTLDDFSVLKYTFASWKLPSGNSIQDVGLTPDEKKDVESLRYELLA